MIQRACHVLSWPHTGEYNRFGQPADVVAKSSSKMINFVPMR